MRVHKCPAFFLSELTKMENLKKISPENRNEANANCVDYTKALVRSKKTEVYVYVEKAFVVHCYFSGDSLEFCLHRNGR